MIEVEEPIISDVETSTDVAPNLARAMETIAKVARLYKKHGKPPVFVPICASNSPPRQRARLAREAVNSQRYVCGRCRLLFLGKTSERCQCKPFIAHKRIAEDES